MKITPEHQRELEADAKPVYAVNQLSFVEMILAVAIGVALGTFGPMPIRERTIPFRLEGGIRCCVS